MYAIVECGGKQFKAEKDLIIKVERLDVKEKDKIELKVLAVVENGVVSTGKDIVGAKVSAEVLGEGKNDKIVVYKYKAKKNERKRQGHRQPYTLLKILEVTK